MTGFATRMIVTIATGFAMAAMAAVIGLGGAFASAASTPPAVRAADGQFNLSLSNINARTAVGSLSVEGLVPGANSQSQVRLANNGKGRLSAVYLNIGAAASSLLDSDSVQGLQLTIDRCSQPWRQAVPASAGLACDGAERRVLDSRPVISQGVRLRALDSIAPKGTDHLRIMLTLPESADNRFEGLSSDLRFGMTATS